jgi:hypothetical protein
MTYRKDGRKYQMSCQGWREWLTFKCSLYRLSGSAAVFHFELAVTSSASSSVKVKSGRGLLCHLFGIYLKGFSCVCIGNAPLNLECLI